MPTYKYSGIKINGQRVNGKIEAADGAEVKAKLREQRIRVVYLSQQKYGKGFQLKLFTGVSGEALVIFTKQLQVLLVAGVPLIQGFSILVPQLAKISPTLSRIIATVQEDVSSGKFLWESLGKFSHVFPKLYIALIQAGETSGQLESVLARLSKYLEDSEKLKKMLKSAMIYPVIVVIIAFGVIFLMLRFVIPEFKKFLAGNNQELPELTKFIIDASDFVIKNIYLLSIGFVVSITLFILYIRSDEGRRQMQIFFFKLPFFGSIIQKAGVARFCRTLNALLSAGVSILDALDICKTTVDNATLEQDIAKIKPEIEKGKTLGEVVNRLKSMPFMAAQMIISGEQTGKLDMMLDSVASMYEQETENMVAGMSKAIEPLMLVFLGGTVGVMLVAMYMPIFKLASGMM